MKRSELENFISNSNPGIRKGIKEVVFRIANGENQIIYEMLSSTKSLRAAVQSFKELECNVSIENEADPQQLYTKGIVDGMVLFYLFFNEITEDQSEEDNSDK